MTFCDPLRRACSDDRASFGRVPVRGPNPKMRDLARTKADPRTNLAFHYSKVLAYANESVHEGNDGVRRGLARFDEDAHNIRAGWRWAAEHLAEAAWAKELCRSCTAAAAQIAG